MLCADPVGALAALGLEGFDGIAGLLQRAGHKAPDRVLLPAHLFHNLHQRGTVLALEQGDHLSGFAALRGPALSSFLAAFLALGAALAGMAFLVALPLAGAPLAACAVPLAFSPPFGFAGSGAGSAALPSPWMASQILLAPALAVLKPFTGFTPGRLFQIATKRSAGHVPASCVSSFGLVKSSKGLVVEAAASSWVPNTLMLFSTSIVKIILNLLCFRSLCGQ